jgi:hypothetical protein
VAVDLDAVDLGVDLVAEQGLLAVDRDAAVPDEVLADPARPDPGPGQRALEAFEPVLGPGGFRGSES